jgi:hypothetical protein
MLPQGDGGRVPMAGDVARQAREKAKSFRKGIEFLDNCGEFTFENFKEADRIGGGNMSEAEARAMWAQAQGVMPGLGHKGGPDFLRHTLRRTFEEGLQAFGAVADKLGDQPKKKGLAFWRKDR